MPLLWEEIFLNNICTKLTEFLSYIRSLCQPTNRQYCLRKKEFLFTLDTLYLRFSSIFLGYEKSFSIFLSWDQNQDFVVFFFWFKFHHNLSFLLIFINVLFNISQCGCLFIYFLILQSFIIRMDVNCKYFLRNFFCTISLS